MTSVHTYDPFFRAITSSAFEREQVEDLAAGRCAAIRVPDLLPRAMCEQTLQALKDAPFDTYGRQRVDPPVMRFGVGISDHRVDGEVAETYWEALEGHRRAWRSLGLPFDPFRECREALGRGWPSAVGVGLRGGRELGSGVAREPNQGFLVHYDDILREFTGNLLDETLVAQFAFNLYLSVPRSGGETVVWRRRWQPGDEAYRPSGSYGFAPRVVEGVESFEFSPSVGEALLFDPRNYHAVRPSRDGRRIALGFSLGLAVSGRIWVWG